jgi:hypothetical protein
MGAFDRILGGITDVIRLTDRVAGVANRVERLADAVGDLDRRLTRVETAIDLATKGVFAAPSRDVTPAPPTIEDKTKRGRRKPPER